MAYTSIISRLNAAGVLEDADTVTVGLVRSFDGAVILATTTAGITHATTGVYSYSYLALGLDPEQAYTLTWTFTKSPNPDPEVATETIQAADQTRTLRGLRRALAAKLGRYQLVTTTAVDTSVESTRTLVCDDLVDDEADGTRYQGFYLYAASGVLLGQQRRVRNKGYTGVEGKIVTRRPFSAAPLTNTLFELHGRLPAFTADGVMGLRECLNLALAVTYHPHRQEFDAISSQQHYDLTGFPWLRQEQQIGVAFDPSTNALENPTVTTGGTRLQLNGASPVLELDSPWTTGQTFEVEVARPNISFIKSGGAWGTSTVGLQADDDETLGDDLLIIETALAYAYRALAVAGADADGQSWEQQARAQEIKALTIRKDRQPKIAATGYGATEHNPGGRAGVLVNRGRYWWGRRSW